MIFHHSNMLMLKKHFLLLSLLKTVVLLNIFVETIILFSEFEQHLLEIEAFCNILNVFTVTFNQSNDFLKE